MFDLKTMDELVKNLVPVSQIFDFYRLVDPDTHIVFDYKDGKMIKYSGMCYNIWKQGKPCDNCISFRCCFEQKELVKIEYLDGKVLLIIASPVTVLDKTYSLELAKDVSDSLIVASDIHENNSNIINLINNFNDVAVKDPFTGLYNKAYINNELTYLCSLGTKQKKNVVGVLLDIDNFKMVNDTYGHLAGDKVLMHLSKILTEACGKYSGWAGKMGGDEFLLVFHDKDVPTTISIMESARKQFAGYRFYKNNTSFRCDFSFGTAALDHCHSMGEFVDAMDKDMYEQKREKKL